MNIINLQAVDTTTIYECFNDAFSDYIGFRNVSLSDFENMMLIRGYFKSFSYGFFIGDKLVGVVINSLNYTKDKAYVISLGVRPAYRNNKIAQRLMLHSIEKFKEINVKAYSLEVIIQNTKAINLYKKLGFDYNRDFLCYKFKKNDSRQSKHLVHEVDKLHMNDIAHLYEIYPSWQNSLDSLNHNAKQFDYLIVKRDEKIVGFAICDPTKKQLMQIGVHKDYRRQGIGTSLLNKVFENSQSDSLGILNVDDKCRDFPLFLDKFDKTTVVQQYELIKNLGGELWKELI